MSKYQQLLQNPPFIKVKKDAREVIFKTVSCMCDNVHYLKFKKNDEGGFKMSGGGFAISNWQMKHPPHDIEWEADDNNWGAVVNMINTGTSKISTVKCR